jgi:hypothetical protein
VQDKESHAQERQAKKDKKQVDRDLELEEKNHKLKKLLHEGWDPGPWQSRAKKELGTRWDPGPPIRRDIKLWRSWRLKSCAGVLDSARCHDLCSMKVYGSRR